jgi:hypothetical protein
MSIYLVEGPQAETFMTMAATETGSKAMLGDPEQFEAGVGPNITQAAITLRDNVAKVAALKTDETRTLVQQHEAAAILSERTVQALEKAKTAISERAEYLTQAGQEEAAAVFELAPSRRFVHEKILEHFVVLAGKAEGLMLMRQIIRTDAEAAAVFFNTKPYLLNMNAENFHKIRFEAVEQYAPKAWEKMTAVVKLVELPAKYDRTIQAVKGSFHNPTLAARAKSRVEV